MDGLVKKETLHPSKLHDSINPDLTRDNMLYHPTHLKIGLFMNTRQRIKGNLRRKADINDDFQNDHISKLAEQYLNIKEESNNNNKTSGDYFVSKENVKHQTNNSGKGLNCDNLNEGYSPVGDRKWITSNNIREKFYVCEICGKCFAHKQSLSRHLLLHTDKKPYECELCGKSFNAKQNLKQHLLVHTGERPHICEICDKSFARKSLLNMHLFVHSGEKPYVCEICEKCFARKSFLNRHMLVHTVEKPYVCKTCDKRIYRKQNLKKHMLVHSDETLRV